MAKRQLTVALLGDSHSRRILEAHETIPSFVHGITPHHYGLKQTFITHLHNATYTNHNITDAGLQVNFTQAMSLHEEDDIVLISGGGNDVDSHICRPVMVAEAMTRLVA